MMTTPTPARTSLSERVAEEIRAWMGRRRITGAGLAKALGVSPAWISYRLSGKQPIDLNDLEAIATAMGVPVANLLPADIRSGGQTTVASSRVAVTADAGTVRPTDNRPPTRGNQRGPMYPGVRRPRRIGILPTAGRLLAAA